MGDATIGRLHWPYGFPQTRPLRSERGGQRRAAREPCARNPAWCPLIGHRLVGTLFQLARKTAPGPAVGGTQIGLSLPSPLFQSDPCPATVLGDELNAGFLQGRNELLAGIRSPT
jgi:hypothetical protein